MDISAVVIIGLASVNKLGIFHLLSKITTREYPNRHGTQANLVKQVIILTLIFAHRGASGTHPENTMLAFFEAERVKADGIELDVHLTKDGEVVIIHDETINRTTNGKGYVKDFTLAEIQQFDAGCKFKTGKFTAKIPTLDEFLKWFRRTTNMICNIEIKKTTVRDFLLEEKTIQLVKQYRLEDRVIISSFNHYSIVYCHQVAPEIEIAPLYMEGIYRPWDYAKSINAKGIHPYYRAVNAQLIQIAQKNGIAVRPFTVDNERDLRYFFRAGTAAVITNYPERAKRIRDSMA